MPNNVLFPSAIPSLTIGGRTFTDLANLIVIHARAGASVRATFRSPNGSSGRAVTAGKTLTIYAARVLEVAASAGNGFQLAYSDNDVGFDSATAFTNPVYQGGDSGMSAVITKTVGEYVEISGFAFQIPATKYVGMLTGASVNCHVVLYGYEA